MSLLYMPIELLEIIIKQLNLKEVVTLILTSKSTQHWMENLLDNKFWQTQYEKRIPNDIWTLPSDFNYATAFKQKVLPAIACKCTKGCMDKCACTRNKICCGVECGCNCVRYESVLDMPKNTNKTSTNYPFRDFRGNPYNVLRSIGVKIPGINLDLIPCAKDNFPLFRNKRQLQKIVNRVLYYPCCAHAGRVKDFTFNSKVTCPNCNAPVRWQYSFCYLSLSQHQHESCCCKCLYPVEDHDLICNDYWVVWEVNVKKNKPLDFAGLQKHRERLARFFQTLKPQND